MIVGLKSGELKFKTLSYMADIVVVNMCSSKFKIFMVLVAQFAKRYDTKVCNYVRLHNCGFTHDV